MFDFKKFIYDNCNIQLSSLQVEQFEKYYNFLVEYNKIVNLTSIVEREDVYIKHFYDSALSARLINLSNNKTLLDMGSGAGFPGVVLKILFPNLEVYLVDSVNKKIVFLEKLIKELNLVGIHTICDRSENIKNIKVDILTARAVKTLDLIFKYSKNLVRKHGFIIAYKSKNYKDELKYITDAYKLVKVDSINLPFDQGIRNNLLIEVL